MKHKHAEMIKVWADNVEMVVFYKTCTTSSKWERVWAHGPAWDPSSEYFMCLPKHEKACLHWLNGGSAELMVTKDKSCTWCTLSSDIVDWTDAHCFMGENLDSRIKPKKEKRWTAYLDGHLGPCLFTSKDDAGVCYSGWGESTQLIEFEIEVN